MIHESSPVSDVAIVGLGPVGAILGNILGQAGLKVVIFEREAAIVPIPRAVFLDGEVMRVIQSIGLAGELEHLLEPSLGAQFINPEGGTFMRRAPSREPGPQGWCGFYSFHQPDIEATLRHGLGRFSNVAVHLRHEVYAMSEQPGEVVLDVEDMRRGTLRHHRARYVVGCDGARSLVRRILGSEYDDLGLHEPWVVADFKSTGKPTNLPDMSTQFCHPDHPITYVRISDDRFRFELKLAPEDDPTTITEAEQIWTRISRWVNPDEADMVRATLYTFHSLIAHQWRRGRLIIAGDAAHQTPPFLGQGLCAGVRDVANLGWKIVAVLAGHSDSLLESYGPERISHVKIFIELAVRVGRVLAASNAAEMDQLSRGLGQKTGAALVYPTPKLGAGFYGAGGGTVSVQPLLNDGQRMDNRIGDNFALVGGTDFLPGLSEQQRLRLARMRIVVIEDDAALMALSDTDQTFVILRPDRYIFRTGSSLNDLDDALSLLDAAWSSYRQGLTLADISSPGTSIAASS